MDRLAAGLAAALAALATALAPAGAQTLETLHVRSFAMSTDKTSLRVGETFHITLAAHVDEPVVALDNLTLPDLAGFDAYGDERRCAASARGSDCTEIVTLRPTVAGERTIAPATLDAIDARNRKPSRFATNTLSLHVAEALPPLGEIPPALATLAANALRLALVLLLVSVAVLALLWAYGRRSTARPEHVSTSPPPEPPDPGARLRALAERLEREPTRASAVALRAALRESVGAREDETLDDLRARHANGNGPQTLAALAAVERAAFCEDARVADAAREALPFLNH